MAFKVSVMQKSLNTWVVSLEGSLNSDTAPRFGERIRPLLDTPRSTLILDMEGLSYISSAGLREIFIAQKVQKAAQKKLIFTNLQPQIRKVFEIANALPAMRIFTSLQEMDGYLDRMQKQITHPDDTDN